MDKLNKICPNPQCKREQDAANVNCEACGTDLRNVQAFVHNQPSVKKKDQPSSSPNRNVLLQASELNRSILLEAAVLDDKVDTKVKEEIDQNKQEGEPVVKDFQPLSDYEVTVSEHMDKEDKEVRRKGDGRGKGNTNVEPSDPNVYSSDSGFSDMKDGKYEDCDDAWNDLCGDG